MDTESQVLSPTTGKSTVALAGISLEDDEIVQISGTPTKSLCEICSLHPRLYKCPRCSAFSCSLVCCKQHKISTNCSGQRDRTAFVANKAFADATLRNDFHFLEDVLQTKDRAKRTLQSTMGGGFRKDEGGDDGQGEGRRGNKRRKGKANTGVCGAGTDGGPLVPLIVAATAGAALTTQTLDMHPPAVRKLVSAAHERRINIIVMPSGMSRRVANNSRYDQKQDTIYWKVHCVFVASSASFSPHMLLSSQLECKQDGAIATMKATGTGTGTTGDEESTAALVGMCVTSMSENHTIAHLLSYFMDPVSTGPDADRGRPSGINAAQNHTLRHLRLARSRVQAFIQCIPSSASQPLFVPIDMQDTLRNALGGQTVIEYPNVFFGVKEDMLCLRRRVEVVSVDINVTDADAKANAITGIAAAAGEGESSGSESEDEEDFMQALREMRGKEVSALKQIIDQDGGEGGDSGVGHRNENGEIGE